MAGPRSGHLRDRSPRDRLLSLLPIWACQVAQIWLLSGASHHRGPVCPDGTVEECKAEAAVYV
jgi:hypothetical protein